MMLIAIYYMNNPEMSSAGDDGGSPNTNIFKGIENHEEEKEENLLGSMPDSQEDLEAIVQDANLTNSNHSSTHNLNKNKINGFVKEAENQSLNKNAKVEELSKPSHTSRSIREETKNNEEEEYKERGGSGNLNEAGSIESPKSHTNNFVVQNHDDFKNESKELLNDSTLKENLKCTNIGWNEENKHKIHIEEDKNEDENSLLNPVNGEIYSKDHLDK